MERESKMALLLSTEVTQKHINDFRDIIYKLSFTSF